MAANTPMNGAQVLTGVTNAVTKLSEDATRSSIRTNTAGSTVVLIEILITYDNRNNPEISYTARNTKKGTIKT